MRRCPLAAWGTEDTILVLTQVLLVSVSLYDVQTGQTYHYNQDRPTSIELLRDGEHYEWLKKVEEDVEMEV